jgi:stringent starvation protein A
MSLKNLHHHMTLFTDDSMDSHRVRICMVEKGVDAKIEVCSKDNPPEEMASLNPYGDYPTLVDRDLVLYGSKVILEYLEERFPHPPLMPVYPVQRARNRLMINRIEQDWYDKLYAIQSESSQKKANILRQELENSLVAIDEIFDETPYFLSEDFTLVDCSLSVFLWRLPRIGVNVSEKKAKALLKYQKRVFSRESFKKSLLDSEREMYPMF